MTKRFRLKGSPLRDAQTDDPERDVSEAGAPCPFCLPRPDQVLIERPLAFVKRDGYPLTKGHALIIPWRHVWTFFETTAEERQAMLDLLDEAKRILDQEYRPAGYNFGINNGEAAGQTVMHVHLHIIPRYVGDTSDPRGGIRWILPEKAAYWTKK
jgi:diadenosine tetraphosphate (Ap4A) HIT family hydrolase